MHNHNVSSFGFFFLIKQTKTIKRQSTQTKTTRKLSFQALIQSKENQNNQKISCDKYNFVTSQ